LSSDFSLWFSGCATDCTSLCVVYCAEDKIWICRWLTEYRIDTLAGRTGPWPDQFTLDDRVSGGLSSQRPGISCRVLWKFIFAMSDVQDAGGEFLTDTAAAPTMSAAAGSLQPDLHSHQPRPGDLPPHLPGEEIEEDLRAFTTRQSNFCQPTQDVNDEVTFYGYMPAEPLPFPGFIPISFLCLGQTSRIRRICLHLMLSRYPFSVPFTAP
jgi:hypothetical protein